MRAKIMGLAIACAALSGCGQAPHSMTPKSQGRYAGIGVFDAGKLWAEMTGATQPTDPASARIADDEHIIVVLDSHTGEVRQCGDHSGYCVAMNPWGAARGALPVKLAKHATDLVADEKAGTEKISPAK